MSPNPPEITLELSGGSLTIRTAQAIYHILVSGGLQGAAAPALPQPAAAPAAALPQGGDAAALPDEWDEPESPAAAAAAPPPAAEGAPEDEDYYRDLSHDMYREVGRLARRLSMSIRDVKIQKMDSIDFESAGQQLEQAKDQLENVVKMTEQATLRIMDLGEGIQGAIDQARRIMEHMATIPEGVGPEAEDELNQARQDLALALASLAEFMGGLGAEPLAPLAEKAQTLLAALREGAAETPPAAEPAPEPAPEPEPAPPAGPRFLFPLDVVFQTVYELCTNETVKKHIKAMWDAGAQGFDQAKVEESLNSIAPEAPDEDNFLNLDLKNVLKAIYQATGQERFQQVLKKMASTADQIFLEQTLPLEAMPAPVQEAPAPPPAPAPAPAPAAPAGPDPALLAGLEELLGEIQAVASALAPPALSGDLQAMLDRLLAAQVASCSVNVVEPGLLTELDATMSVIFGSVNSIIEALSFQDLSGQVIYRIVRLLTDFQVSLLAMVVSFGSKLKAKAAGKGMTTEQSEKMAQREVDKVMESLGVHDESQEASDAAKLDQDSVNNLLDNLGF